MVNVHAHNPQLWNMTRPPSGAIRATRNGERADNLDNQRQHRVRTPRAPTIEAGA
jgi:hypothetical protein